MTVREDLLNELRHAIGTEHVITDGDLNAWETDWRKRNTGKALAVIRPFATEDVANAVRICAQYQTATGVSIVPQGGNTGLVLGSTPDASGLQIVLSMQRMNRVRGIDAQNHTITVEAGCVLQTLQEKAAEAGFLLPLSLAAEGSCTIGGNLGTNAGGTQVVRFGNTRELCLGLEVVTAQGRVWNGLTGLRKDNTGYDLRNLFIGSEGTLGIITAATMKLFPMPASQLTAWALVPSLDHALNLLGLSQRHLAAGLTGFEVMGQVALGLVEQQFPNQRVPFMAPGDRAAGEHSWCVLLEHSDHESEAHARQLLETVLEAGMTAGCVLDAVVAESVAQASALWSIRESIPLAQAKAGLNIKHDISLPVSSIPDFVETTDRALQRSFPGVQIVNFGHLGDGNLHYNVQAPLGIDGQAFVREEEGRVNSLVFDSVARFNGSISAEHGIGSLKVDKLGHYKSPVALDMMRAIKLALDPANLMNPGRVIRVR